MYKWIKIVCFIVVFIVGCKSYEPTHSDVIELEEPKAITNSFFSSYDVDYVYKASLKLYNNKLGGILVVKKISNETHRVVFTTEFGNKLLDIELSETTFTIKHIIDELNKKLILNTLVADFRVLLKESYNVNQLYDEKDTKTYKSIDDKFNFFVKVATNNQQIIKIIKAKKYKEKVSYHFNAKSPIFAESIKIEHQDIKLNYDLKFIGQIKK